MSIADNINKQIVESMKARNEDRLRALRGIKAAFLLAATETGNREVSDEIALKTIQKLAKQRKDSIEIFSKQNRQDLVDKETTELKVLEEFLPQPLSEAEILSVLKELISATGASGMQDLGKIMPQAMAKMSGKADGATISKLLKQLLSA
ncbi:MAG: GatB/YqeY domain-containing protein [Bacteroidetes bacterium]|nr:GatB/YqeY domain-containing protein [Bacteroidota bacterium]